MAVRPEALVTAGRRYRGMAYVTGVVLLVLCCVGIPLQVFAHNLGVVKYVGTTHGILYLISLGAAFLMTRQVRMKVASPQTVLVLLAGTIPVLTFVVERWVTHRYINPALAAAGVGPGEPAAWQAPAKRAGGASSTSPSTRPPARGRDRCTSSPPTCIWSWKPTPVCSRRPGWTPAPGRCWKRRRSRRPPGTCSTSAAATGRSRWCWPPGPPAPRSGRWMSIPGP